MSYCRFRYGSGSGSGLDPWKILWIRIRQNDADPLDPDPQHWLIRPQCTLRHLNSGKYAAIFQHTKMTTGKVQYMDR